MRVYKLLAMTVSFCTILMGCSAHTKSAGYLPTKANYKDEKVDLTRIDDERVKERSLDDKK